MDTYFVNKSEKIIDSVGIIVLSIIFVVWRLTDKNVNIAGTLAALLSLILFIIICIRFVHKWMLLWNGDKNKTIIYNRGNIGATSAVIFVAFLIYDFILLYLIHFIRVAAFGDTTTFTEGLNLFLGIDTGYYLKIAEQWYVNSQEYIYDLVFYPLFPILIRCLNVIVNNYLISATILSGVFYAGSAAMLYRLLLLDYDHKGAIRGIKYFAIIPASFFFAIPMSESLFIFLSISSIYLARKNRWLPACILGALCAFTRSLGIIIFAPLVFIAVTGIINNSNERKTWIKRLILTLIIPMGTCAYLYINYKVAGNPLAFSELEYEKWGQSMGLFFDTTAFQIDNGLADIQQPYYTNALGIWFPNVAYCFCTLIVMVFASKKLRADYSLWFICYYVLAIGATYLISAPRYLVACLPLYPAIVQITKNKKANIALSIVCIACAIYYLYAFAARWEVF